jgi:NAD(P)-dependent dehydrogenase (short-subunit alcohol dehydrogenase family)
LLIITNRQTTTQEEESMSARDLEGTTAIVTGASRGFGRATAVALANLGTRVVGVARSEDLLEELGDELGDTFTPEVADVAHPSVPARLISRYRPQTLVLNAGATPPVGSLVEQSWETFSTNWNVDVRHVFGFIKEALAAPLDPGSVVVSLSSGAAIGGSPLSGGYAGAKGTIKLISSYAGLDAHRQGLGIRFVAVLPQLSPATDLGKIFTEAYAAQQGLSEDQYLSERFGGVLSTEQAAETLSELIRDGTYSAPAYMLTLRGLIPVER